MTNFYKILFLSSMVSGTLIAISSYSWFSMWIGLEINLLSIIPLMSSSNNLFPSESALKYFITQVMASSILLFSIIMIMNLSEFAPQNSNYWFMMMMNSSLFLKMGAAPFHAWFPEVMNGLSWSNCFILLTWQKIAPMILVMYSSKMIFLFSMIIIISSLVGGILGLNQTSMRKVMAYSSINHIGWMLASMLNSISIWSIYFLIYSIISANIIIFLKKVKIFQISQLSNFPSISLFKLLLMMNFFSLGGVPPFLGFLPKWLTINNLMLNKFFFISLILIISTLVTLFFYLRLTFPSLILYTKQPIIGKSINMSFSSICMNFISLSGLLIWTLVFNFI
uniref:NADH dehydrogenase subunit 2 n=1 Tax=Allotraeus orientalis TaxID=2690021 RepID=UPI001F13C68B|nr:NADH dehydrogenase subunit 2 [Allotraeus orientalis]UKQ56276.1 NADH dehydrogenase subunit 2 [Allotraeus orientalis]